MSLPLPLVCDSAVAAAAAQLMHKHTFHIFACCAVVQAARSLCMVWALSAFSGWPIAILAAPRFSHSAARLQVERSRR